MIHSLVSEWKIYCTDFMLKLVASMQHLALAPKNSS